MSQGRDGRWELAESAKEFPKTSARRGPTEIRREALEQRPTALDDQEITL